MQWFDAEICGIEEATVDGLTAQTPVGINLADEVEAFALFGNATNPFELAAEEPKMRQKDAFADWLRCHNEVHQEQCVKISSAFVSTVLFQSARHRNFGSLQQP